MRAAAPAMLLLSAGCSGDPVVAPVPVTLHTGSALLVALDPLGDGVWQRLPPQADLTVEVGARWRAASVCGASRVVEVVVQAYQADAAGVDVELPCRGPRSTPVPVEITARNSGSTVYVVVGSADGWVDAGTSTFYAYPGTWDLYAADRGSSRIVLQRDVVIGDDTAIDIDFEVDGFALEERAVAATGARVPLSGYAQIALAGGTFATLPWSPDDPAGSIAAISATRLVEGDVQHAQVSGIDDAGHGQYATIAFGAAPIEVAMPPAIVDGALQLDGASLGVTWVSDDESDRAQLWAQPRLAGGSFLYWSFVDPAAARAGVIELPDLAAIPGWDPAWNLPRDAEIDATLSLTRDVDDGYVGASWHQRFAATAR